MIKIGITGQSGFVGTHLYNTLGLYPDKYKRIPFEDDFFKSNEALREFVKKCDAIVHLAAMNRHNDPEVIYETNLRLVKQLINACEATKSTPPIFYSLPLPRKNAIIPMANQNARGANCWKNGQIKTMPSLPG